ncbi:MAG: hypothetical protein HT580_13840 [Dechloromonas sp.]|nr:MAG: hypothetical protein HT580_13840 [Dechloromonas sp.]
MQVQTLPAASGWAWLSAGFAIFRRNPPLLAMLVITYWLTVLILNILPVIGAVAASLIIPGLSVGLMQAARDLDRACRSPCRHSSAVFSVIRERWLRWAHCTSAAPWASWGFPH